MKIDIFDIKILNELDCDARQPYSKIGKKIRRSKQFVKTRINNLEKNKVIEKYVLDASLRNRGYLTFNLFIQFQRVDREKEDKILRYLENFGNIGYCLRTLGNWDLFVSIKVKDINEFYTFLKELNMYCFGLIKRRSINLEVRGFDTNLKFLDMESPDYFFLDLPYTEEVKLSETEKEIFDSLRKEPLISYFDISEKTKKSFSTIKSTIKKLRDKKIIKRFRAVINLKKLGYDRYLFLLETSFLNEKEMKYITDFLKEHKNIDYIVECIGNWNLICNVYSKDIDELIKIIREIKDKFKKTIESIEFLRVISAEKEIFKV